MAHAGGCLSTAPPPVPATELLNALPSAVLLLDEDSRVRDTNAAAEALLNLSAAAMVGRALADLIVLPADYAGQERALSLYDLPLMTTRGQRFRADFIVTPLVERPGWSLLMLHQGAAASRMGHRLESSGGVRAATGAAAMLAHEIKNPLSGIRGAAQLIESGVDGEARALTALIRSEVDRIAALIDRMQLFTDDRPIALASENIYPILDHVRDLAANGFAAGCTIRESYDPSLPPVLVHRDSLVQLLINLVKNAAEATGEGGSIQLTTAYRHGVSIGSGDGSRRVSLPIELCVIDDGPGAPPDIVEHLFEPFVTTKRSGQGLGLALVDKLVRDMGGIIQYAREGEPERTVFRMLLPRGD